MDPITGAVLAAVTAYVTRKAEDLVGEIGDAAYEKAKAIFGKLKHRWAGDPVASADFERFAQEPAVYGDVLKARIEAAFADDPRLRDELGQLAEDMGPQVQIVQRIAKATGVKGIEVGQLKRGRVGVEQDVEEAETVEGGKFDSIG